MHRELCFFRIRSDMKRRSFHKISEGFLSNRIVRSDHLLERSHIHVLKASICCLLVRAICNIRYGKVLIFNNLLASLLGLDIAANLTVLSIYVPSSHAPEDRDTVASCATNATGLSVLRVAELKLSLSRGAREVSDRATKLCSNSCIFHYFSIFPCSFRPFFVLLFSLFYF